MSPEKDKILCEKYPKIFKSRTENETLLYFGFECHDGWFDLIDSLCSSIQRHIDYEKDKSIQIVAAQVKSKFGGLRFYYDGGDDFIHGAVDVAENISQKTCEMCGRPGQRVGDGWIFTMCKSCNRARFETKKINT